MDNIAFVESLYAAFGRGDVASVVAACAPDVRWELVGRSSDYPRFGVRHGPTEVGTFFQLLGENEEFTHYEPVSFNADGNKVFVLGKLSLRFKKSDRTVTTDWIHIFTIRGGKVAVFKEFLDTAQFVAD